MRVLWRVLGGFGLMMATLHAGAQKIDWESTHFDQIHGEMRSLPLQDQSGILARLHVKADEVRVQRITSPVGAMFVVQAVGGEWCGPANCEIWILDDHYRLLLQKSAQGFRLQTTIHEGRPEVLTSMHGSAADASLSYWQSQGGRYVRVACADATYEDKGGTLLKTPHIETHPCGAEE